MKSFVFGLLSYHITNPNANSDKTRCKPGVDLSPSQGAPLPQVSGHYLWSDVPHLSYVQQPLSLVVQ